MEVVQEAWSRAEPDISCAQAWLYLPEAGEEQSRTFSEHPSAQDLPLCILGIIQLGLKMPPTPYYLNIGFQANRGKKMKERQREGFAQVELNN